MPPTANPVKIAEQFSVNPKSEHSLILQIKQQVTWMIASGKLHEGDTLPSIRELAEHLEVNMHTVRQAYNRLKEEGLIDMQPRLKARVLAYTPTKLANQAIKIKTHTIGIILPTLSNPFYQSFLKSVQSIFQENDYLSYICPTYDDSALAWRYYAQLAASGVDGVLSVSHDMSEFIQSENNGSHIPLVSADYPLPFGYSVEIDHEQSGFIATQHLLRHGCRRIALVRFVVDVPPVLAIQKGYEKALQDAGLNLIPELVIHVNDYSRAAGAEAARRLLAMPQKPQAVFVIADQIAMGFMETFQQSGISIPDDIAVTSFNNIPEAALFTPPLTTVATPIKSFGETAASMLIEMINGQRPAQKHVKIPCKDLIIRQSCGCKT